jgi:hypothetical protein
MCGLSGGMAKTFLSLNEQEVVRKLFILSQFRGEHSSGFFDYTKLLNTNNSSNAPSNNKKKKKDLPKRETHPVLYWKHGGNPGYHYYEVFPELMEGRWKENNCKVISCHTRHATRGVISDDNAHPFCHGNILGMHNGTIFGTFKGSNDHDTDSEALYKRISEEGLEKALKDTYKESSSMAYALVYMETDTKKMHFIRNSQRPLHYVKNDSVMFWASTAIDLVYSIPNLKDLFPEGIKEFETNKLYVVDASKTSLEFEEVKEVKPFFQGSTYHGAARAGVWKNTPYGSERYGEYWRGNQVTPIKPPDYLAEKYITEAHRGNYERNYKNKPLDEWAAYGTFIKKDNNTKFVDIFDKYFNEYTFIMWTLWKEDHPQEWSKAWSEHYDKTKNYETSTTNPDTKYPIGLNRDKLVSEARFIELTKDGCAYCSDTLLPEDCSVIFWDDEKTPLCFNCQSLAVSNPNETVNRCISHSKELEAHFLALAGKGKTNLPVTVN